MPNQIHTLAEGQALEGVHLAKVGDILITPLCGGYGIYRWRGGKAVAALGFEQDMDGALALAKRKQQQKR
jgi:hypothetical protein